MAPVLGWHDSRSGRRIFDGDDTNIRIGNGTKRFCREIKSPSSRTTIRTAVHNFDSDGSLAVATVALALNVEVLPTICSICPQVGIAIACCRKVLGELVWIVTIAGRGCRHNPTTTTTYLIPAIRALHSQLVLSFTCKLHHVMASTKKRPTKREHIFDQFLWQANILCYKKHDLWWFWVLTSIWCSVKWCLSSAATRPTAGRPTVTLALTARWVAIRWSIATVTILTATQIVWTQFAPGLLAALLSGGQLHEMEQRHNQECCGCQSHSVSLSSHCSRYVEVELLLCSESSGRSRTCNEDCRSTHKCRTYDHGIRLSIHVQFCHLKFR